MTNIISAKQTIKILTASLLKIRAGSTGDLKRDLEVSIQKFIELNDEKRRHNTSNMVCSSRTAPVIFLSSNGMPWLVCMDIHKCE